ncbi:hypothetical protein FRC00_011249, partial [Tulasnella sp. 408]
VLAIYLSLRAKSSSAGSTQAQGGRLHPPDEGTETDMESKPGDNNAKRDLQGMYPARYNHRIFI